MLDPSNVTLAVPSDQGRRLQQLNDAIAHELLPAMTFMGVLMVVGIPGNTLVCYVYGFRLRMRTQHFLILTLAILDLLACFIAIPNKVADMRYYVMFESEFACRTLKCTTIFTCVASSFVLIVIAVDRYMKICRPWSGQMSLRHTKMAVVAVLVVSCVFTFPAPVLAGNQVYNISELALLVRHCSYGGSVPETNYYFIYTTILFAGFVSIVIALAVLYALIWRAIKKHNRRVLHTAAESTPLPDSVPQTSPEATATATKTKAPPPAKLPPTISAVRRSKTTAIAVSVTVVFLLSYVPYFALSIVTNFEKQLLGGNLVSYNIFLSFPFVNAVANPFIYSALNPSFRLECSKLFLRIPFCRQTCSTRQQMGNENETENETEENNETENESKEYNVSASEIARQHNNENDYNENDCQILNSRL